MSEEKSVFLDGRWVSANLMVKGFKWDGFPGECTILASELLEMRRRHQLGLLRAKNGITDEKINLIAEKIIDEDDRLNDPREPMYLHSHCTLTEGESRDDNTTQIVVSGYRLLNVTGGPVYVCSCDGQYYEPHFKHPFENLRNRTVEAVVLSKVLVYPTTYALEQEYASLSRLKAADGLCEWKQKLLNALQKLVDEKRMTATCFSPAKYTLQFTIEAKDLKKYPVIYDPNTDLNFSILSSRVVVDTHPGHIINQTRRVIKTQLDSVDSHQSQVLRVVQKTTTEELMYQRINDVILSIKPVTDFARPRVVSTVADTEILDEYVEIHVRAGSSFILDGATYRPVGVGREIVLLHRYSLKEAMEKRILFSSPEHAKSLGDLESMQLHERNMELQRVAAEREREKNRYEENLRAINETKARLEADLAREKQAAELHAMRMKAEAEHAAREHERQMQDLRKQMAEDAHRNSLKEEGLKLKTQESKGWTEGLKVVGAVVGVIAATAVAVVKLWPKASSIAALMFALF